MKTYYVDVENVHKGWLTLLKVVPEEDYIRLYTSKNTLTNYTAIIKIAGRICDGTLEIREAVVNGKGDNSLDHFLLGELYNQMLRSPSDEYVIVSNDHDYDVFINERLHEGYMISRLTVNTYPEPVNTDPQLLECSKKTGNDTDNVIESEPIINLGPTIPVVSAIESKAYSDEEKEEKLIHMLTNTVLSKQGKKNRLNSYKINNMAKALLKSEGDFNDVLDCINNKMDRSLFSSYFSKEMRRELKDFACS